MPDEFEKFTVPDHPPEQWERMREVRRDTPPRSSGAGLAILRALPAFAMSAGAAGVLEIGEKFGLSTTATVFAWLFVAGFAWSHLPIMRDRP